MVLMKQQNKSTNKTKWYVTFDGEIKEISLQDMNYLYSMVCVDYRAQPVTINNYICTNIFCPPLEWCVDSVRAFGKKLIGTNDI